MIVITIELVPRGFAKNAQRKGRMIIANDGTGTKTTGNYTVITENAIGSVVFQGRVRGFPRTKHGVWRLLKTVMDQMYPSTQQLRRR
jgi:hypothetical protein